MTISENLKSKLTNILSDKEAREILGIQTNDHQKNIDELHANIFKIVDHNRVERAHHGALMAFMALIDAAKMVAKNNHGE